MRETQKEGGQNALRALALLEEALALLDELEVSAEIGAHVDLAVARLRKTLDGAKPSNH